MNLNIGDSVCISVKSIYDKFGAVLGYCHIHVENNEHNEPYYYDIWSKGVMCHCDGESATVIKVTEYYVEFRNNEYYEELDPVFKLSHEECKYGIGDNYQ